MIKATLLRAGMIIKHDGDLYSIYSVDHRTPGNKRAAMATKMRNLRNGSMIDHRFRAEEFLDKVTVDEIEFEYLYSDGDGHHFMNTENYEQLALQNDVVGDTKDYLIPNTPGKNRILRQQADRRVDSRYGRSAGRRNRAEHSEGDGQLGDETGEARNRPGHQRAAVRRHRRQSESRHNRRPLHPARAIALVVPRRLSCRNVVPWWRSFC